MVAVERKARLSVPPVPLHLLRTIAVRRIATYKAIVVIVSISTALAVAASFTVTAMTETMIGRMESRVVEGGGGRELGAEMVRRATRAAFLPWHVVSLAAAVVALSGIACVLSVNFVGRKKSLGILKTLGGTTRDLTRLLALEAAFMAAFGLPLGLLGGSAITGFYLGTQALSPWCFVVSIVFGVLSLASGVYLPVRLVRNASCAQLLLNRPVYAFSNPSCAQCGLCGGF
jgi:ABC-type lipoprotein release transport system permease subunit